MSEDLDHPLLVRARLRRDVPAQSLARILVPTEPGPRSGAAHSLVWYLFSDHQDRKRDFLWREMRPGEFLILAMRTPADPHGLFAVEYKPFCPVLQSGQRLRFDLRANPVVSVAEKPRQRGKRHDVVMHALSKVALGERTAVREAKIQDTGRAWLDRQGQSAGFNIEADQLYIDHYERIRIPRRGARPVAFSTLTFKGVLTVRDPHRFLRAVVSGFGAAKAYGCGLMLIRKARR